MLPKWLLSSWEGIFSSVKWSKLEIIGGWFPHVIKYFMYLGPSTHTWGYGKFATLASQIQMLSYGFASACIWIRSGKKPAIRPRAFIRPYIN